MCHCRHWIAALVVIVLSALPTVSPAQFDTKPPSESGSSLGQSRTQKWEFGTSIRAVGGTCVGLSGTFPVPTEWPEQQVKVVSEEITSHVQRHSYRQIDGLRQMVFNVPQLAAGETATCFVTLEITKQAQLAPTDTAALVIPKDSLKDARKYLGPSPFIDSGSPKVRTLAREFTAEKETAWEQVQAIVEGVRDAVRFEPENKNVFKGSTGALRDGKADKEDLTATFVAVCRAAKIPARMVWSMDYCYAEFYLEDAMKKGAWYPCVVHEEVELGAVKDLRPILEKGDNFKVPEEEKPQRFIKEHLTGKGASKGRPTVEFRRRALN